MCCFFSKEGSSPDFHLYKRLHEHKGPFKPKVCKFFAWMRTPSGSSLKCKHSLYIKSQIKKFVLLTSMTSVVCCNFTHDWHDTQCRTQTHTHKLYVIPFLLQKWPQIYPQLSLLWWITVHAANVTKLPVGPHPFPQRKVKFNDCVDKY